MILLRKFFSKKEDSSLNEKEAIALIAAGGGALATKDKVLKNLIKSSNKSFENTRNNSPNAKKVKQLLLNDARKKGIGLYKIDQNISFCTAIDPSELKRISNHYKTKGIPNKFSGLKETNLFLGNGSLSDVDTVAHELGHGEYLRKNGTGGKLGKLAHKYRDHENLGGRYLVDFRKNKNKDKKGKYVRGAFFLNGVHSGIVKEKNKAEGKNTGIITKYKSVAIPAAFMAPTLISEALASRHGYRAMKKLGANKEVLKAARKRLGKAYKSYIIGSGQPIISGAAGELVGRGIGKLEYGNN